jgi:hypothetical protein
MAGSNLVGFWTGRSAGSAPFRIVGGRDREHAEPAHRLRLCQGRDWKRGNRAEQCQEVAAVYRGQIQP